MGLTLTEELASEMHLPGGVVAAGVIPFLVVLLLTVLFSFLYVRYFRHRRDSECSVLCAVVFGLTVALLTSALLPVDIFIVSYMKNPDGTFKDWATDHKFREKVTDFITYAYYVLYGLVIFCAFLLLPFAYFYFEEKDDDADNATSKRCCSALKYTTIFLFLAAILLIVGVVIPLKKPPARNTTEWENIKFLINEISTNTQGEDMLLFVLNVLTLIGMFFVVLYTGSGLSIWPVRMIKGSRNAAVEYQEALDQHTSTRARIEMLRGKEAAGKLTSRDRQTLAELEETERLLAAEEHHLKTVQRSLWHKCRYCYRPLQILLGIIGGALALLLWLSLLLTNIDKVLHSLGYKMGYVLSGTGHIPNPLDITMVYLQKVFPLDYVLFLVITVYLVICTISGIQNIGLWFLCVKMYRIRMHRTRPQALLLLCVCLMYSVLAINVLLYSVYPQYTLWGNQHYLKPLNSSVVPTINSTGMPEMLKLTPCDTDATEDDCTMTRAGSFLMLLFYKMWFFGAAYYYATWAFLLIVMIAFFVALMRSRQSSIAGLVDRDDFDDSDDDLIRL